MFESTYFIESIREKHRNAPCRAERERYMAYLLEIGTRRERIRDVATMLLHVVRLLELNVFRPVRMDEIIEGTKLWLEDPEAQSHRKTGMPSPYQFKRVAINWFRFQGMLLAPPERPSRFASLLSDFLNAMRLQRGLAQDTLQSYRSRITAFLNWLELRGVNFSDLKALDIEEYLAARHSDEGSQASVAAHCAALRTFFGFAQHQGWCSWGIRESIARPRTPRVVANMKVPSWEGVRQVISSIGDSRHADLRARAMILLHSIYAFRSVEVRGLTLEDIDWRRGTITVRRAKGGKTQQFPLQDEVGEAIALYLERARPKCSCRSVFVTLHPPYRPILGHSMGTIVGRRVKKADTSNQAWGPHMFRRACATQLLRTGSSLQDIADLLGHSNLRSVSIYARFDTASLRDVAEFSLRELI
jgi:integrase/recombinase XerD